MLSDKLRRYLGSLGLPDNIVQQAEAESGPSERDLISTLVSWGYLSREIQVALLEKKESKLDRDHLAVNIKAYYPLKEIGRGGMGVVYLAEDRRLNQLVAIKVIQKSELSAIQKTRFLREVKALKKVRHANILAIEDFGETDDYFYLVTEYIRGTSLQEFVETQRRQTGEGLSEYWLKKCFLDLASAVKHCHKYGVIHRDIKPENVLIEENTDRPVLIDFGITKNLNNESIQVTRSSAMVGTFNYMSPEQFDSDHFGKIGPHSDVWALGTTLYYCLTESTPHEGKSPVHICTFYVRGKSLNLDKSIHTAKRGLAALCQRCLSIDNKDRATIAEFIERLETIEDSVGPKLASKLSFTLLVFLASVALLTAFALFYSKSDSGLRAPEQVSPIKSQHQTSILLDIANWDSASDEEQFKAVQELAEKLTPDYRYLGIRKYACNGEAHNIASFIHDKSGIKLNLIPGGQFVMGVESVEDELTFCKKQYASWQRQTIEWETPSHEVRVRPILVGQYELLQREWDAIGGSDQRKWNQPTRPIESVSWFEVQSWLRKVGSRLKLLSEAEWEYCCRAGSKSRFYWGNDIDKSFVWYSENSDSQSHAFTEHIEKYNAFGLTDMSGNVFEWVQDSFIDNYKTGPSDHRPRRTSSEFKIFRGGGWSNDAGFSRSTLRNGHRPEKSFPYLGFRVCRDLSDILDQ